MKKLITYFLLLLATACNSLYAAQQQPINFIGFNGLKGDGDSHQLFNEYISLLKPLMKKHNIDFEFYKVEKSKLNRIDVDIVSIGSARNAKEFQRFFADPELHKIMPLLHSSIDSHTVFFTQEYLGKFLQTSQRAMMRIRWDSVENASPSMTQNEQLFNVISANTGLGVSAKMIDVPAVLSLSKVTDLNTSLFDKYDSELHLLSRASL